ncbi:MAG: ABC transporter ATP-binding protein [Flavobacteriales bacterium]|nr:ABC transporter ATP-binding protein [Flavobacteriales bacterium]
MSTDDPHVIEVQDLRKSYRLGVIGGATLGDELRVLWASLRGRPNPLAPLDADADDQRSGDLFWALRGVTFEVRRGEILGIIGKNGAGKSTLLKLLSRITTPTQGVVRMKGRVSSLLEVGTGFNPELTGRENIYLNGTILGMKIAEIDRKLDEIIAFSGIQHHIDTPTKRYSSGMKVRLGFAVAAHLEPEIMIIDEVLAVGDAEFQRKCLGKMKDVAGSGRTVLFVSHNMVAVQSLCTRVIWLQDGKLIMDGPPDEVVKKYLHTYTVQRAEATWPEGTAPGREDLDLVRVALAHDAEEGVLTIDDPFRISIRFRNQAVESGDITVGIHLINDDDVLVFNSNYRDEPTAQQMFPIGEHTVECPVPGGLLNDGDYRVTVNVIRNGRFYFRVEETISFTLQEAKRRGTYFRSHGGVIRPLLPWRKVD